MAPRRRGLRQTIQFPLSLLHKATGYSHHSEKIFYDKNAGVVRVPVVEQVPAMIFYLKRRDPERWSDRREGSVQETLRVGPITPDTTAEQAMEI
jgi:hypothetical protein